MRQLGMGSEVSEPKGPCAIFQQIRTRFIPHHNALNGHMPLDRAAGLQRHLSVLKRQVNDIHNVQASSVSALHAAGQNTSLTGVWKKDKSQSDSMDLACELVKLPWIYRKALLVLNQLEVEDTDEHIKTTIKAGGLMDVVECYPYNGEVVVHKRRDKRKGHHTGRVVRKKDGPCVEITWDNPFGGDGSDTFVLSEDGNMLTQASEMTIRDTGTSCSYKTVYRRCSK